MAGLDDFPLILQSHQVGFQCFGGKGASGWFGGCAWLDILKVFLGIERQVLQVLEEAWRCLPGNPALGVHETHCITAGFELGQGFG